MSISHLPLKSPEQIFASLWSRVPNWTRLTFFSSVILGFIVHMYMFVNKLPNHDDINHLFSADYGTASGRWLLPSVLSWDGPFSIPWLIGTLSILCLAAAACFTVSLLRIRRPLGCIVTSAIIVSFPSVTATFTYMFTSDSYFFSLMLAAFGAYAAVRFRWGIPIGAVAVTLSMGIYQSYFGVAAVLMVGALLFETLDGERTFKELFFNGLKLAGTLAAAMAAYMVIVKITSRLVPLTDYMGISDMGKLPLRDLPLLVFQSYYKYFTFFLRDESGVHFGFLKYAFVLTALCTTALFVWLLWNRRLGLARTVLAVVLAAVYPLAGNLVYVMVSGGFVHDLMVYGLLYILLAPVALAEYMEPQKVHPLQAAANWVILLSIALTAYSYTVAANEAYLKIDVGLRQCTSYSTRLLDKIESCEGYQRGMPVVLLGNGTREEALNLTPQLDKVRISGVFDFGNFRTCYTYGYFLVYYLGFSGQLYMDGSQVANGFAEMDRVQDMPLYPSAGSIQVIDDMVVVKLNGA